MKNILSLIFISLILTISTYATTNTRIQKLLYPNISVQLNTAEFSKKLPLEIHQLVESFDCFSDRDKTAIYAYVLSLRYRFEHLNDKEALKKSDLNYWRLWHIVSDITFVYRLSSKFDNILEEILFPTPELKKQLKRLRWAESGIRTDGSSESSARMRRYDKILLDEIMKNPPKWSIEDKNNYLSDYNLTFVKAYPEKTIAKSDYENIVEQTAPKSKERNFLLHYAQLQEDFLRYYDQPKKRDKISNELSYLSNCFKYFKLKQHSTYYGNKKRELVGKIVHNSIAAIYGKEMLPRAIKEYCENKIPVTHVSTFEVIEDKPIQQVPSKTLPSFKITNKLLDRYKKNGKDIKYLQEYISLSQKMLQSKENDFIYALRLLRLQNCISAKNTKNFEEITKAILVDVKNDGYTDEYTNNVMRPMLWWKMTISMKMEQEGESKELKHFFDCNASVYMHPKNITSKRVKEVITHSKKSKKTVPQKKINYDRIIGHKDEIFKYYAATFVNKATPDMNNTKAIEAGIIPPEWIETNNTIKSIGVPFKIEGMPKGGIKLTYSDIPKGKNCERITTLNIFPEIHFDRKTYDGIDYLLIDGHKLKYRHFNGKHAKRLCDKQDMHTVSFVIENTVVERKYRRKEIDCQLDHYKKIKTIDTQRYKPDGIAISGDHMYFAVSGSKSALYNATISAKISDLPQELDNAFNLAMDEYGKNIAVSQGRGFSFWNILEKRMSTRIAYGHPLYDTFSVSDLYFLQNKNILAAIAGNGQEIRILDPINKKMITKIVPKFFEGEKKSRYRGPRITALAIAHNGKRLFIGGNRKKIEVWDIPDNFGTNGGEIRYHDMIEFPKGPEVGAIKPDPINPDNLYIAMKSNQLHLYSLAHKKILKTYVADSYMDPEGIQISYDGKYIMVTGSRLFIWKTDSTEQFDIFSGDGIVGGLFKPFTHQVITVGPAVDRWELKK